MPFCDAFGRNIEYLRLSVIDRCDFRCFYCIPKGFKGFTETEQRLSRPELVRLVRLFAELGVSKVRLTGGEPLVRGDIVELTREIAALPGIADLSLSTNASRLAQYAQPLYAAGIRRINVSLDSLRPETFREITQGELQPVLEGLEVAKQTGFQPIKINMVVMRDLNLSEVGAMVDFCAGRGFTLRFIETMPVGDGGRSARDRYVDLARPRRIRCCPHCVTSATNTKPISSNGAVPPARAGNRHGGALRRGSGGSPHVPALRGAWPLEGGAPGSARRRKRRTGGTRSRPLRDPPGRGPGGAKAKPPRPSPSRPGRFARPRVRRERQKGRRRIPLLGQNEVPGPTGGRRGEHFHGQAPGPECGPQGRRQEERPLAQAQNEKAHGSTGERPQDGQILERKRARIGRGPGLDAIAQEDDGTFDGARADREPAGPVAAHEGPFAHGNGSKFHGRQPGRAAGVSAAAAGRIFK